MSDTNRKLVYYENYVSSYPLKTFIVWSQLCLRTIAEHRVTSTIVYSCVPVHLYVATILSGHSRMDTSVSLPNQVWAQKVNREQTCLGSGYKRVWAQTCVATNVSAHIRVWAQVATNVSAHIRVWAQTYVGIVMCSQS